MKTEIKLITPEIAASLLETNTKNRTLRDKTVIQLADAIKAGQWMVTHQGIAVSQSGVLLDGQHRLAAIVKSNIAVQMMVSTGVGDESFMVIDSGLQRNISDRTGIRSRDGEVSVFFARAILGHRKPTAQTVILINDKIKHQLSLLGGARVATFSSAPFRSAAVIAMINNGNRDYVIKAYDDLVHFNTDTSTPIIQSAFKYQLKGSFNSGSIDGGGRQKHWFSMATRIFREKNKNLMTIKPKNFNADDEIEKAKKIFTDFIG